MVTAGHSGLRMALLWLVLLHAAAAARLTVTTAAQQQQLGDFDVFTAIQEEVDTMNSNLENLSVAISNPVTTPMPSPTTPTDEPASTTGKSTTLNTDKTTAAPPITTSTITAPTTTAPTTAAPTTTAPTNTAPNATAPTTPEPSTITKSTATASVVSSTSATSNTTEDGEQLGEDGDNWQHQQLFISRGLLSVHFGDDTCEQYKDILATLADAQEALDLVTENQLANSTVEALQGSNNALNLTAECLSDGQITPDNVTAINESITATEESGKTASETIGNILNPPTPAPEDDSGFRAATITLGVLFSLSLIAVAGLAFYVHGQKTGGLMS